MFLAIIIFLVVLAIFDLFVGVSNDAVNFLGSAIGAKIAKWRTILIIASLGVMTGALMSNGMMDIARHGIFTPDNFSFREVITIFLAVMVTDVLILDLFNSLKLPTSTTVSLVFELLGAAFVLAILKINIDPSLELESLLNFQKSSGVIIAIFVSVGLAFVSAVVVQWLARIIFTFKFRGKAMPTIIYGALAVTLLVYFIFLKGMNFEAIFPNVDIFTMLGISLAVSVVVVALIYFLKFDVFKFIVLLGTFALAMAFAGNDLVNFIGVPLAGLSSYTDFMANGSGNPDSFLMHSLSSSAQTPKIILLFAAVIMILAITFSRKAKDVVKTSVDLSRQDESDNMFGSSLPARSIVRNTTKAFEFVCRLTPSCVKRFISKRYSQEGVVAEAEDAAFDVVRASVNLVLAAFLIIIGTTFTLPLSTTYVTFMVAMGTSLADLAWGRESAVFKVTGVLSVIGGWFLTAGLAFCACALVCLLMFYGGFVVMALFMIISISFIVYNNVKKHKKNLGEESDEVFSAIKKTDDPMLLGELLNKHVSLTQSNSVTFAGEQFRKVFEALRTNDSSQLGKVCRTINRQMEMQKKRNKKEILCLRKLPPELSIEKNTWFYLAMNSATQYNYCLKRMVEPIKEHIENNFTPLPSALADEFLPLLDKIEDLLKQTFEMIDSSDYSLYDATRHKAAECRAELSELRAMHIKRIRFESEQTSLRVSLIYLNLIQESQMIVSTMRHQLRATKNFMNDKRLV